MRLEKSNPRYAFRFFPAQKDFRTHRGKKVLQTMQQHLQHRATQAPQKVS